jgi:hypothetical protein
MAIGSIRNNAATGIQGSRRNELRSFYPTEAVKYRDGGSIALTGPINRGVSAKLFLDYGINSPTRGQVFVQTKFWNASEWGERRELNKAEYKSIAQTMERVLEDRPNDPHADLYADFLEGVQAHLILEG